MRVPDDIPVLTDGVVTLRASRPEDADGVYEQCTDPVTQQLTTVPAPYTRQHAEDFLARRRAKWEDGSDWGFSIEADGGAEPSSFGGSISVRQLAPGLAEVAYGAHPAVRGKGVMTRALRLICDWAFEAKQIQTMVWQARAGNLASWRAAWRNGFTFEGSMRAAMPQRGALVDGWRARLLSTDTHEPKTRWLETPRLAGHNVVLRPLEATDEERCLETTNDPAAVHWLTIVPTFPHDADAFRQTLLDKPLGSSLGRSVTWAMADPDDGRYLGTINLFGIGGMDYASAEFGYWAHPDARGRGVTTEAVRLVTAHAFTSAEQGGLGLERVSLGAAEGNIGSQRVARAAGFTETGHNRHSYDLPDGSVVDMVLFDLLKSELRHS
ncbi:MAG: GNAT family N-acetyltransferase [Nocardioidaceae bacterium]